MVGECLNKKFNPFCKDNLGQSAVDYAKHFEIDNGQNIQKLVIQAQNQWKKQFSEEQIA